MTEARYPMEHEPDYARATSTEPTGGSACLQSTPQIARRSEEHTSELQSLMRISYAVFCLKKKKIDHKQMTQTDHQLITNTSQNHHPSHQIKHTPQHRTISSPPHHYPYLIR